MTTTKTQKAQKAAANGAEALEAAFKTGADQLKDSFDKATQSYDQLINFNKEMAEAVLKAASAAGKGVETINAEVFAYSRQSVEEGVAASKAMLASKSVQELLELQSDFTKAMFETYFAEATKVRNLALETAKAAAEPLQARITALAELIQAPRAA